MDSLQPTFKGSPAVQGAVQPGAPALPGATRGLFGTGGEFKPAQIISAAGGAAAGFGAYGAVRSGQEMKAQFDMQAGSYETQAEMVRVSAKEQAIMLRKQLLQDIGSARASAAARGIDTGSGTPMQIEQESIGNVGKDIQKLESGANVAAAGSKTSAARSRSAGVSAAQGGYYKGAESIASYALR
jgi:hypothetical protein